MDYKFCISPTFESVFLINGRLVEGGEIIFKSDSVAYITVLPLSAVLLPYTVKMVGYRVMSNPDLCKCYHLGDGQYHLKILPRHNYVYSVPPEVITEPYDLVDKFFISVKAGKIEDARECLSPDLSGSIDDNSLISFFDDFIDIVAGETSDKAASGNIATSSHYFLIKTNGDGVQYSFIIKNGVVDNIIEID